MYQLTIYDANNWVRKQLEVGKTARDCINHIMGAASPTIVVWDGPDALARRRAIYPGYKSKRTKLSEDFSQQFEFIGALVRLTHATNIRVKGFEADDVIAQLASEWSFGPVIVYSNDKDLLQCPKINLYEGGEPPVDRASLRLYKSLVGDKSDNIPGIPGFGDAAFAKFSDNDRRVIEMFLREGGDNGLVGTIEKVASNPVKKWLIDPANVELIRAYWKITGFYEVPNKRLNDGTKLGTNQPEKIDEILQEFLQ